MGWIRELLRIHPCDGVNEMAGADPRVQTKGTGRLRLFLLAASHRWVEL